MNRKMMIKMGRHFSLVIIVLVISFFLAGCTITGRAFGFGADTAIDCSSGVSLGLLEVNGAVQACYRDNSIYFVADNTGSEEIEGVVVELGADYDITMSIDERIPAGESSDHSLNFGAQKMSGIDSIAVYPIIYIDKEKVVCRQNGRKASLFSC